MYCIKHFVQNDGKQKTIYDVGLQKCMFVNKKYESPTDWHTINYYFEI